MHSRGPCGGQGKLQVAGKQGSSIKERDMVGWPLPPVPQC